ncbi:AbiTii domain-containing protein [Marinicrinis sediminis]|uniref:AbiTii domain-containing protein n=1 Tax=Marinicrinis sediminis TaxID=1652465 RepID=A0ABW5R9N7_9BACL
MTDRLSLKVILSNFRGLIRLLRKAYTLAKKLQVSEFADWANLELNGYKGNKDIPDYREVHGEIKAFNPYHGYIPAYFQPETNKLISKRPIVTPITEIEEQIKMGETQGKGMLMYKFPSDVQLSLMKMSGYDFEVSLHIPTSQFQRIVDRVRNIILEWTLKLEEQNILGEGMTFTEMEKQKAAGSIVNIIGNMINSQLQQNTTESIQSLKVEALVGKEELIALIGDVKRLYEEIQNQEIKNELSAEIEVLEAQVKSPKPKNNIIRETLKSIRNIAEGTTGSLVATGIQTKISALLSNLGMG